MSLQVSEGPLMILYKGRYHTPGPMTIGNAIWAFEGFGYGSLSPINELIVNLMLHGY